MRVEERSYDYDAEGNVVRERLLAHGTRDGVPQPRRGVDIEVAYARSAERHIADRVARVVERDETGAILRERRRYYDGAGFAGLPLGAVERGLRVREEVLVLSASDFAAHYEGMTADELGYHEDADADGTPSLFADQDRCAYDERGLKVAQRDPRRQRGELRVRPGRALPRAAARRPRRDALRLRPRRRAADGGRVPGRQRSPASTTTRRAA